LMVGKFERQRPFLEPSEFTNHLQRTRWFKDLAKQRNGGGAV
jgi:hypothetical protein